MRIAGFGCAGLGGLIGLLGAVGVALAFIPGVVNQAETGTAIGIGGGLCGLSLLPLLIGVVLIALGGRKNQFE